MRNLIREILPIVRNLTVRTQTEYDDKIVDLVQIVVDNDDAWKWFMRLFNGAPIVFQSRPDGVYPTTKGCDCPKVVQDHLNRIAMERGEAPTTEASAESYGAGWSDILKAIRLVKDIIDFLKKINPSLELDAA